VFLQLLVSELQTMDFIFIFIFIFILFSVFLNLGLGFNVMLQTVTRSDSVSYISYMLHNTVTVTVT